MTTLAHGELDLVIEAGRIIDPETDTDRVLNLGIRGGRIAAWSDRTLHRRETIDASGLVVAPGFVDMHSHAQGRGEQRLQALDGVTTALELEAGAFPVARAYQAAQDEGRHLNYGYSASWAAARSVVSGAYRADPIGPVELHHYLGATTWHRELSHRETDALVGLLRGELADGALGIGVLLGYAPHTDTAEYVRVAALAAEAGSPAFTHARTLVEHDPTVPRDGAEEIAQVAGETGAHLHYCHVNSTSVGHLDRVLSVLERAQAEGARVSTEAYPYGQGMTSIGSLGFAPERLLARGVDLDALVYVPAGEPVRTVKRLEKIRRTDPGGFATLRVFDEDAPENAHRLAQAILFPDSAVASDAMPFSTTLTDIDALDWPTPSGLHTHPRTAGTFSRFFARIVRESAALTLAEGIRRCTLVPAQILEGATPAARRKGRLGVGADADVVVFDPATIVDHATYTRSTTPSTGVRHLVVNGSRLITDGRLDVDRYPGRPLRGAA